ncbi:MAG: type IV secretion system DNA-binding domain-containing protein [Candidatus Moraniibacteriota bacterium]|nr:MAG: type IV secretion system DNA-binding domain-containing protein [Candidatus Moranbacteria bacterium]
MSDNITYFAKTNFRNEDRVFGIKADDRRRHMYVIGKTGMGKTNMLENLVIQDIQHGHGVAFIDPHGDTAEKLIRAIPPSRVNDVIYFNPSDQDFPVAFNVMEHVSAEYRHLVASGLVGVFKKIWADSWGPRLEYILRNAILALLEYPGSTLLGVMRILVDKEYRKRVVDKVTDPVVKSFWVDEYTKWNDRVLQEVIAPIQNKVGQFLSSSLIRNIVGQTVSSFDVRDIMDRRKILIMNLSKGRIGEDNSALIGAMMITKIQLAAMGRVDIPEDDRQDFYLYVDEFQNFATESFGNILSEARKYRLNLILANQYILQIEESVRDAIFGNTGTIISFRVGATDAEFLEKEFSPIFLATDIVNLEKYHIYLKLMIDGISGDAFSATTLPPIDLPESDENAEKVVRISRERYAAKKQDVEDKIRRWTGILTEEERQNFEERMRMRAETTLAKKAPVEIDGSLSTPPSSSVRQQEFFRSSSHDNRSTPDRISRHESPSRIPTGHPYRNSALPNELTISSDSPSLTGTTSASMQSADRLRRDPSEHSGNEISSPSSRPLYKSVCAVCGVEIDVPFKPDGKRPTFCREHFKSFQKTIARTRTGVDMQSSQASPEKRSEHVRDDHSEENPAYSRREDAPSEVSRERHSFAPKAYVSMETPLSLGQMQYIAPKPFKRSKEKIDLGEVRRILSSERTADGHSDS